MANNMETTAEIIESIRELIERIEMSPRTPVALTDIAPESAWEAAIIAGDGPALGDTFVTAVLSTLHSRYPLTLPYPFERVPMVAVHEGWWDSRDDVPRTLAVEIFEASELTGTASSASSFTGLPATQQVSLLRALLEVSMALIVLAQGHPAYQRRS
ncbi:hypothetical protein [Brevibacterium aurantiacum]|uniref:hypothetical protein n=1 Tax=Brevibacterium aurantiacum TaxID=273384 RepID=UPI003F939698